MVKQLFDGDASGRIGSIPGQVVGNRSIEANAAFSHLLQNEGGSELLRDRGDVELRVRCIRRVCAQVCRAQSLGVNDLSALRDKDDAIHESRLLIVGD